MRRKLLKLIGSDKTLTAAIWLAAIFTFLTHYFYDPVVEAVVYREGFVGAACTNIAITCAAIFVLRCVLK